MKLLILNLFFILSISFTFPSIVSDHSQNPSSYIFSFLKLVTFQTKTKNSIALKKQIADLEVNPNQSSNVRSKHMIRGGSCEEETWKPQLHK